MTTDEFLLALEEVFTNLDKIPLIKLTDYDNLSDTDREYTKSYLESYFVPLHNIGEMIKSGMTESSIEPLMNLINDVETLQQIHNYLTNKETQGADFLVEVLPHIFPLCLPHQPYSQDKVNILSAYCNDLLDGSDAAFITSLLVAKRYLDQNFSTNTQFFDVQNHLKPFVLIQKAIKHYEDLLQNSSKGLNKLNPLGGFFNQDRYKGFLNNCNKALKKLTEVHYPLSKFSDDILKNVQEIIKKGPPGLISQARTITNPDYQNLMAVQNEVQFRIKSILDSNNEFTQQKELPAAQGSAATSRPRT